jgi:hypothetical protein
MMDRLMVADQENEGVVSKVTVIMDTADKR